MWGDIGSALTAMQSFASYRSTLWASEVLLSLLMQQLRDLPYGALPLQAADAELGDP
jgi:hypothetical protein